MIDIRRFDHAAHGIDRVGNTLPFGQCNQPRFFYLSRHIDDDIALCCDPFSRSLIQSERLLFRIVAVHGSTERRKRKNKKY